MSARPLPGLRAAAARLPEQAGELPPVTITCDQPTRVLPPDFGLKCREGFPLCLARTG